MNKPKILIKITSRSRCEQLKSLIKNIYDNISDIDNTHILVSLDSDDTTIYKSDFINWYKSKYPNINVILGESVSKIDAINRDINSFNLDWDIIMNVSDDMVFIMKGFDDFVREQFNKYFPDFDGCPSFFDGYRLDGLPTMAVLGKKYYDRFSYIYNPEYNNLWCDDEMKSVAEILNKFIFIKEPCFFKHEHPANNSNIKKDEQYKKQDNNDTFLRDKNVYLKRKQNNFYL